MPFLDRFLLETYCIMVPPTLPEGLARRFPAFYRFIADLKSRTAVWAPRGAPPNPERCSETFALQERTLSILPPKRNFWEFKIWNPCSALGIPCTNQPSAQSTLTMDVRRESIEAPGSTSTGDQFSNLRGRPISPKYLSLSDKSDVAFRGRRGGIWEL